MTKSWTPYADLPDSAFWKRAVTDVPSAAIDPVAAAAFTLSKTDRVATAGSCFAQHVSRRLAQKGYNYFVTEPAHPHPLLKNLASDFGYGTFSARYGNIYTARQLLQLFDRAYSTFHPVEDVWPDGAGRYFDPFRPTIQPNGFASEKEYWIDRQQHLAAVRRLFEELDVFLFTLGLTEVWLSRADGAAYPVCPGAAAGTFDTNRYEFHNLTYDEVTSDLCAFISKLRQLNARARIILTVSPVPLIATMENRHVLVATTYSKSVLRVACDQAMRTFTDVAYFPSYEIVTGSFNRGRYFADDLRNVTEEGVDHVMRLFYQYYGAPGSDAEPVPATPVGQASIAEILQFSEQVNQALCDEELLDNSQS